MKRCPKCGETKPRYEFNEKARNKDGLQENCRACNHAYLAKWRAENLERKRAMDRAYAANNREHARAKTAKWVAENPERKAAADRRYALENKDRLKASSAAWRAKNVDAIRKAKAAARIADPERARNRNVAHYAKNRARRQAESRAWAAANPDRRRAQHAARKASKIQATPAWANRDRILAIYNAAVYLSKETAEPYHVDHVVPLRHPLVCGLHCEANLRPMRGVDNLVKSNRHWPDMP